MMALSLRGERAERSTVIGVAGLNTAKQLRSFLTAVISAEGQTAKHRPAWEAADIPCKAVYPWPPSWTLGAAQHA